ncbi:MAG TPA: hypothetical protein VHA82_14940 [Ramlibacter sp.]|uniref:hypothetical protein n=1 Tax=Ramlibacter sp. TaxID=1917967 RepID=UPI002BB9D9D2|nr:hypothetical protein [Ramlibacter sp.]HVZ45104.1 hypothetical protein [Ramlibacter sp.]
MEAEWIDQLQWPAMAATLLAAWLVGSRHAALRNWGFWTFLGSNALWIAWGLHDHAFALVGLQVGLAALNIRGARKAREAESHPEADG